MGFINSIVGFILGQIVEKSGTSLITRLADYYTDPGKALPNAIDCANNKTWQLIELALAGDFLSAKIKQFLVSGQIRGVLAPLRQQLQQLDSTFCQRCLVDIQQARKAGLLTVGGSKELIAANANMQAITDPALLLRESKKLLANFSKELTAYPHLSQFLTTADSGANGGYELLVTAFGYFLRQEISKQPQLCHTLQLDLLTRLVREQAAGWEELHQLLSAQTDAVTVELSSVAQKQAEILAILQQIHSKLANSAKTGAIKPHLSSVLRDASNIKLLGELEQRLKSYPSNQIPPAISDAIGRLAMAVGVFANAEQHFHQAAQAVASTGGSNIAQAEALYNRYRALLEQNKLDAALTSLLAAANLAPAEFAPFPLLTYTPKKILGAGGFGVAFLCHHQNLDYELVIKTLHSEDLERDIAEVFREGRILMRLRHPAIIDVTHADYAVPACKQRPYLVMEHFAGISLGDYLKQHGCLTLQQTVALAKPIAQALQAAHTQNILHRDIKPDNILVRLEANGNWVIKLIDFGLAARRQVINATVAINTTQHSLIGESCGGTYQFSAPEQLGIGFTVGKIGPCADIYAFGKTLSYAMFEVTQLTRRHYRQLGEHPLADLLSDCLEQDIALRPQSFAEVLSALGDVTEVTPKKPDAEELRRQREAEEAKRKQEAEAKRQREIEAKQKQEAELKRQQAEVARQKQEAEAKRQREIEAKQKQEAELKRQQAEVARQKQEAEAKRQREIEAKQKQEAELKRQQAEVARQKQEAEAKRQREAEARQQLKKRWWESAQAFAERQQEFISKSQPSILPAVVSIHGWPAAKVQALQQETATALDVSVEYQHELKSGHKGPLLRLIPAGKFLMGSPASEPEREDNEGPQHEVTIAKPLAMGKFAVTFAEYDAFCEATGRDKPGDRGWGRGQRPVINVSWHDAVAYCVWLSEQTGYTYRLPTEAEWEYACRAGTVTPFFWGDSITPKQANYDGDYVYAGGAKGEYRKQTVAVDNFAPNAFGLYQMHGNVYEWTCSAYKKPYDGSEKKCVSNNHANGYLVLRGGSWDDYPHGLRSAGRLSGTASGRYSFCLGFRLIQD